MIHVTLLDDDFIDIPHVVLCPHCGSNQDEGAFDFHNDSKNDQISQCGKCEKMFGFRFKLETTVDYYAVEPIEPFDQGADNED